MNTERADQYLPRQARNVTHVSRLQSVQAAVDQQLEEMVKEHPNRRVALIVFNNEVSGVFEHFHLRLMMSNSIPANSLYFGGRLPILTSNLCKIDKHNFLIIYNFKNLIIAPNRVG